MHAAQANNHRTGTVVFQTHDTSLTYLERLVECRDVEFVELGGVPRAFDPEEILQKHLGGSA
jgi:hypothetical protein